MRFYTQGTESVMALVNLALLTGNMGKPGAGINPLRGQNNVQGAAQMGCDPAILTGSVAIDERRGLFEKVWGAVLPHDRGLDLMAMIDAAAAGRLKALWIIGYDILPTLANVPATRAALAKLDLVIVQDLFMTETAKAFGHVFLPAASAFEKDGTFMNAERRVQRVRATVPPPGEALADWRIVCAMAERMGHGAAFAFTSPEEIWNEVRAVWPEARGITYERLDGGGLQWPCRDEADPETEILHKQAFARAATAPLARIDYVPTPERESVDYPFLLSTGRSLYQFNAGSMTLRTENLRLRPTDVLEMSPADTRPGLADWRPGARPKPSWRGHSAGRGNRSRGGGMPVRDLPRSRRRLESPDRPASRSRGPHTGVQGHGRRRLPRWCSDIAALIAGASDPVSSDPRHRDGLSRGGPGNGPSLRCSRCS